ncbi:MAG: JAB domain-containing protein [Bacteroidetes bacterium]|nr:MAG: JAB domain-containing protein [Bacteroidota bacterium]
MSVYSHIPIKEWALEDRPREKLRYHGMETLSDAELMAILLGTGTRELSAIDLAHNILEEVGGLHRLSQTGVEQLTRIKGIGPAKAISLVAAFELGRRKTLEEISECRQSLKRAQIEQEYQQTERLRVSSSEAVAAYLTPKIGYLQQEVCYVLFLNRANEVKSEKQMFIGGISATVMDVRLIFREAVHQLASAIIVAHNHPSGNLTPSRADVEITQKLVRAGQVFDIVMLDHIIVSPKGFYSFADENQI